MGCKDGEPGTSTGRLLGITAQTVSKWRRRFADYGLDGLNVEIRSSRPRSISDEVVQEVIDRVRHEKPEDASHWRQKAMRSYLTHSRLASEVPHEDAI
ncbi:helix-turn-helix domain-containing protein [Halomonas denitrificans]|uniref:helix-turn-helix domain-containing protein n=1 Tax=Halomonas denitrificans TaxID=370769 RepID=UPI001CD1BD74|nr:helix-turn-helix domain-containing protein [Halomonas denitrificans]